MRKGPDVAQYCGWTDSLHGFIPPRKQIPEDVVSLNPTLTSAFISDNSSLNLLFTSASLLPYHLLPYAIPNSDLAAAQNLQSCLMNVPWGPKP
jgi:hypothetical protein